MTRDTTAWKKFGTGCAKLLNGRRFPASSGGVVDVEGPEVLGQCKLVQECSLAELTRIVSGLDLVAAKAGKRSVAFIKLRSGRGNQTPILAVVNATAWFKEETT